MKTLRLMTAALALGTLAAAPTLAQDDNRTRGNDRMMQGNDRMMSGQSGMNPMAGMSEADQYKMRWVYQNLDAREVRRYQAMGVDEATLRGAANIALRTALPLSYVLRRVQISGLPLSQLALNYGLAPTVVREEIPGMGAENLGTLMGGGTMGGMSGGATGGDRPMMRDRMPGNTTPSSPGNSTTPGNTSPGNTSPSTPETPSTNP